MEQSQSESSHCHADSSWQPAEACRRSACAIGQRSERWECAVALCNRAILAALSEQSSVCATQHCRAAITRQSAVHVEANRYQLCDCALPLVLTLRCVSLAVCAALLALCCVVDGASALRVRSKAYASPSRFAYVVAVALLVNELLAVTLLRSHSHFAAKSRPFESVFCFAQLRIHST